MQNSRSGCGIETVGGAIFGRLAGRGGPDGGPEMTQLIAGGKIIMQKGE